MFNHLKIIEPIELKSADTPKGRFYTTPSGVKYPSITTILGHGDKQWLTDWRQSLGQIKADAEMKRAADRGSAVHTMLEKYIQNDPTPQKDQHFSHITEFNSLKSYIKKIDNVIAQEIALYSDILKIAGRVDCIADYNNKLSVIDFKTSTRDKNSNMIPNYYKQATFYALAFQELYNIKIDNIVIIMSVEKGLPLIFHEQVDNWIEPLILHISQYYNKK